ncbi:uncharacterized protein LOC120190149 [Hibiscus syriacus]|uniref:uncharacterized protein LOC120190149 n=1 Tax=Hibiscus syriacus TaxID=106335 RepID=UPI001922DCD4|nr:uncharacterized protein LOC120190149 [Hibiscus syriacus]
MGSSVMINAPSSPNYRTPENEGGDCYAFKVETYLSDLNQQCQGIGHEVSRFNCYCVENEDKLMHLKNRIEEFNQCEIQLTHETEQLERKVLMSILQKRFEDDEVEKFREVKEIEGYEFSKGKKLEQDFVDLMLQIGKINDKLKDFGIGIEETKKCEESEIFKELGIDLYGQQGNLCQLVSDKEETMENFEKLRNAADNIEWGDGDVEYQIKKVSVSDNVEEEEIGDIGTQELGKEIELLEAMLERGSVELLDLKAIMEEIEGLKGPEKVVSDIEVKMGEFEPGLWELKRAIVELKEKDDEKLNWGSIIASVGVAVVAVAAMVFIGRPRWGEDLAERRNKHKTG